MYSTPVITLVEADGIRRLVAPSGEVRWVRNTRAAGQLTLRRGRDSETVAMVEVGPVEVRKETRKTILLPPLIGGMAPAGGIILVLVGARRGSDSMNRTVQS
jgi:hypothetical protein